MTKRAQPSSPADIARLQRLAKDIEALAQKDQRLFDRTREISKLRHAAASELYQVCSSFVAGLNQILRNVEVLLDPSPEPAQFRDTGVNLIQINVRGRILEIEFSATDDLLSTEDFRIPYTLCGTVRAFNQDLLDRNLMEEQCIFFTVETNRHFWRYFDPRTHRSGAFDHTFLISMMELLI